jgi:hypothetical protein
MPLATTLILQNSINFVAPFLKNQPLQVSNQEPAVTAGNMVLATMLGAPMRWRFNRKEVTFNVTTAGGTDYSIAIAALGFIEEQWLKDSNGKIHAINGAVSLGVTGAQGRPEALAPQFDDNQGNITFRLDRVPAENYTVYVDFQQKAPMMTSAASQWAPIPDEFQHIFDYGFLCLMSLLVNDSRFPIFETYFVARLLGTQDGLSDQAKDIFVGNWMARTQTLIRSQGAVQSGVAGRGR